MKLRMAWRGTLALGLAAGLVGVSAAAVALPTPDSGPISGGTGVTFQGPADLTFTHLASGEDHTLAIAADGDIYAWGQGGVGALGQGSFKSTTSPVRVQTPENEQFTQVSAGRYHSVGLTGDGTPYAWGRNDARQAGGSSWTDYNVPVAVETQLKFAHISAGGDHTLALTADGDVYEWGDMSFIAPGPEYIMTSHIPIKVEGPGTPTFTQVSAGMYHSAGLSSDGSLYVWGWSDGSFAGNGPRRDDQPVKITAPGSESLRFTQISAGMNFTLALAENGEAYAWGVNGLGQLGTGGHSWSATPVKIHLPADEQIVSVAAGALHALALTNSGAVYGWGNNWGGQAGAGTEDVEPMPLRVDALQGAGIAQVDAGATSASARTGDGVIYTWGANHSGQLGNGASSNTPSRVPLPILTGVVSAVTFDGTPGTGLDYNGDGSWSVITPAGTTIGAVDVGVAWTSGGEARPDITHPAAFLYTGTAPTVSDPVAQIVTAGEEAVFTVVATGTPTPAITWQIDTGTAAGWTEVASGQGVAISEDGLTLTLTTTPAHNGYQYRAVATNSVDAATSNSAKLTVNAAPAFTTQPSDLVKTAGDTAKFSATATGLPTPGLSWQVLAEGSTDWVIVTPADGAVSADGTTLEVAATDAHSGFQYRAVATNFIATVVSDAAVLTVSPIPVAPVFTLDPADQIVTAGDSATFTTSVTGVPIPTIRWEFSTDGGSGWASITSADGVVSAEGETLEIATTTAHSGFQYRAIAENGQEPATSKVAKLTVNQAPVVPTFEAQPEDQQVATGGTAEFTVSTTGVPAPTVTWETSTDDGTTWVQASNEHNAMGNATSASLLVVATKTNDGSQYRAIATNAVGSVTSRAAILTVDPAPVTPPENTPVTTPAATTSENGLASTGASPAPAIWIAAITLALGAGLVLTAGRRRV